MRLQKECRIIQSRKKFDNFIALPDEKNIFVWNFLIFGLTDCDYEGGFYHGRISFPPEYPMKPPSLLMFTPSGRFDVNKQMCTSFSNFHPESWNPLWGVESIVIGLISFMVSEEFSTGCVKNSSHARKTYAKNSLKHNYAESNFISAFPQDLLDRIGAQKPSTESPPVVQTVKTEN